MAVEYRQLPNKEALINFLNDEELTKNAPDWFYEAKAPLTFEPWVVERSGHKTLRMGNSGFLIDYDPNLNSLEHHFIPNGDAVLNKAQMDDYVRIYLLGLLKFLEYRDTLEDDNVFRSISFLKGDANREMYISIKRLLKYIGDDLLQVKKVDEDGVIFRIKLRELLLALEDMELPGMIERLKTGGEKLIGNKIMDNYVLQYSLKEYVER